MGFGNIVAKNGSMLQVIALYHGSTAKSLAFLVLKFTFVIALSIIPDEV